MNQKLIDAVRNDPRVGSGSCTTVDECLEDSELWEIIKSANTEAEAVRLAHDFEGLKVEQALNARWGEDDDPQLAAYREWHKPEMVDEDGVPLSEYTDHGTPPWEKEDDR